MGAARAASPQEDDDEFEEEPLIAAPRRGSTASRDTVAPPLPPQRETACGGFKPPAHTAGTEHRTNEDFPRPHDPYSGTKSSAMRWSRVMNRTRGQLVTSHP